jgi:hypothetical protein
MTNRKRYSCGHRKGLIFKREVNAIHRAINRHSSKYLKSLVSVGSQRNVARNILSFLIAFLLPIGSISGATWDQLPKLTSKTGPAAGFEHIVRGLTGSRMDSDADDSGCAEGVDHDA